MRRIVLQRNNDNDSEQWAWHIEEEYNGGNPSCLIGSYGVNYRGIEDTWIGAMVNALEVLDK